MDARTIARQDQEAAAAHEVETRRAAAELQDAKRALWLAEMEVLVTRLKWARRIAWTCFAARLLVDWLPSKEKS